MTVSKTDSEQSRRLFKRLHDALPRYAQRPSKNPAWVLARYNDQHGHAAIVRVAERAYKMYINETWSHAPYPEVAEMMPIIAAHWAKTVF